MLLKQEDKVIYYGLDKIKVLGTIDTECIKHEFGFMSNREQDTVNKLVSDLRYVEKCLQTPFIIFEMLIKNINKKTAKVKFATALIEKDVRNILLINIVIDYGELHHSRWPDLLNNFNTIIMKWLLSLW